MPIAEQKNIYPACERIHHQEKDMNHQWMLCRVGRDTDQRCGQPSASSNIASLENQRLYYTKLRPRALFLNDDRTLFASFLFSFVVIASRRSTPKCHGFILTVSFISARTNIFPRRKNSPGVYREGLGFGQRSESFPVVVPLRFVVYYMLLYKQ